LAFLFSKDLEKKWEGQPVLGRISGYPFFGIPVERNPLGFITVLRFRVNGISLFWPEKFEKRVTICV
jgi:hypothetical protein